MPPVGQRDEPSYDLVGLGYVAVDDLLYVDSYPPPDRKARVLGRERQCGGLTAAALLAASALGSRCAYIGVLGDDELSRFAVESLEAGGVDLSHTARRPGARPAHSTIIVDSERGTRNIFSDLEGFTVPEAGSLDPDLILSTRVLFVDHADVATAERAARMARGAGVPVVADLERDESTALPELLSLIDHLVLSRDFALRIAGEKRIEKALHALWNPDRRVVVVTCGEEGCWYLDGQAARARHVPAFPVEAVDTTGCGDVFHGVYASALASGMDLSDRLRFAAAAAALKATARGAHAGAPSLEALQAFLRDRGGLGDSPRR